MKSQVRSRPPRLPILIVFLLILLAFIPASRAQTVRNLTNLLPSESFSFLSPADLDDAGSVVYAISSSNLFGTNPRRSWQIFEWDPSSGLGSQVTNFDKGVEFNSVYAYKISASVSVSDDGRWLAFISCSDLVGLNHDGSTELYVMRPDGTGMIQLTSDPAFDAGTVYDAMIAGSGNRVVFLANTDALGTNPGRHEQVFVVNRDGTGLRQLTSAVTDPSYIAVSISDDGDRIVFSTPEDLVGENPEGRQHQVFAIQADGTGLRQISHVTGGYAAEGPVLSGNGTIVVFSTGSSSGPRVSKIDWDGTGLVDLASGQAPSITDDAQTIVYATPNYQIWKIRADGTGNTQLTSGVVPSYTPVISGDGSRIAFSSSGGEYPGGNNPDGGQELMAMDSSGGNLRQLTVLLRGAEGYAPEITADGTRVFFESRASDGEPEIFRIQADGTGLAQVTDLTGRYIGSHESGFVIPDCFRNARAGAVGHVLVECSVAVAARTLRKQPFGTRTCGTPSAGAATVWRRCPRGPGQPWGSLAAVFILLY